MDVLDCRFRMNPIYDIGSSCPKSGFVTSKTPNTSQFWLQHKGDTKNPIISISIPFAQILFDLKKNSRLTASSFEILGVSLFDLIRGLVFDEIVQVKGRSGKYESGPFCPFITEALGCFPTPTKSNTMTSILSWDAVYYGWHFAMLSEKVITQKLYSYNTFPQMLGHKDYEDWAKRIKNISLYNRMEKDYLANSLGKPTHWFIWEHKGFGNTSALDYKLYVSPIPYEIESVFQIIVEICCRYAVPAFKIGANPKDILRPDKLVLYFSNKQTLHKVACAISQALKNVPAQGVPFTNPIDPNGLISWAVEPQRANFVQVSGQSWRIYVAKSMARYLKLIHRENKALNIQNVLQRIRFDNVEPNDWNEPIIN